ncbi:MAG TPA: DUF4407 domain-containing protein [Cyclobacteriaceae bacterium]|nr:DUF4407 domain-containing protein [Cyclobacteriaceae bacterium]
MNKIKEFLWFCSGVFVPLIRRSPSETNKYIGIGGAVLFTGILAALSAGYALYTVFDTVWMAIFFGLLWGLLIFNLDRFIVSSMRKKNSIWSEWKLAIPRLALAVILALVISKPLELKIFEKEINRKLDEGKALALIETKARLEEGFPEIQQLDSAVSTLRQEIREKAAFRDQKQQEYDDERFGNKTAGTTGLRGLGINAAKKEEQLNDAERDYRETNERNQARIDELERQGRELLALRQAEFEKQQPGIDQYDGMAARIEALGQLTTQSKAMYMANLFIILLFVAVETAPIFVKLLAEKGPYDYFLEKHEEELLLFNEELLTKSREQSKGRLQHFLAIREQETSLSIDKDLYLNQLKTEHQKKVETAKIEFQSKEALKEWEV